MDKRAWWATVPGVTKSQTWLSDWTELNIYLPIIFSVCYYFFNFSFFIFWFLNFIWRFLICWWHYFGKIMPTELKFSGFIANGIFSVSLHQFSSVAQSCPILCNLVDRSTSVLPVHHQLPEFTKNHVYWVGDTTQPSHPSSSPSPPAFNLSQHQGLFKWVSTSHQVAKVLEFQLQHQSSQWTPRTDLL